MLNKKFTLSKEEFIHRSMKGEVFICADCRYFYDRNEREPFRVWVEPLKALWCNFDGTVLFTLEEPKPTIERRWRWLRHLHDYTQIPDSYYSDRYAIKHFKEGWCKKEDDYIDVKVEK